MSNSAMPKLVIIFPILTTILLLTSISGIIGNSIIYANQDDSFDRSYTINNLEAGGIQTRSFSIPESLDELEVKFIISYLQSSSDTDDNLMIYLSEEPLPSNVDNVTALENSVYFDNEILDSGLVNNLQSFFPRGNIDILYVIFGNLDDVTISFNVLMEIQDANEPFETETRRILSIIFSAIFTALFLGLSAYLWSEYFGKVDRKILTDGIEDKLQYYSEKALTWEIVVLVIATFFAISGYSEFLLGEGWGSLVFAIIGYAFVYYNFTNRQKIELNILNVLRSQPEISLSVLANEILEDKETTKKALLNAMMYSDLPAHLDLKTETVYYLPEYDGKPHSQEDISENVVEEGKFQVASTEVRSESAPDDGDQPQRPLTRCAYCDTEAISVNALFCHSCGASMSSAK